MEQVKKENFFVRLFKGIGNWFKGIGLAIAHFFVTLPGKIKDWFLKYAGIFKNGDFGVKLSFLIMGSGAFARKQIAKGFAYLGIELLFIFYMIFNGVGAIGDLFTLGTSFKYELVSLGQTAAAPNVPGDNSMLCLLFGVVAIMVIAGFLLMYFSNIKSAYDSYENSVIGKRLPTFKDDVKALFDNKFYILLLVVSLVGVIIFTLLPLIFMILIAFTNYQGGTEESGFNWVGLKNFGDLVGSTDLSTTFFPVLGWTIIWALCATFLNYFLGVGLALLINKKGIKLQKLWRMLFVLTIAVPQFVSLLLMKTALSPTGPVSSTIESMGGQALHFFDANADPFVAKVMVIVINLWVGIPYSMLITSGILMNIPADLYESARIDGADKFTMFRKITLPYIMFIMGPYLITQFVGNINNFNIIYLLTGGGPILGDLAEGAGSTSLLVTWLYNLTTGGEQKYFLAATIGILTFIVCAIVSLITYKNSSATKSEGDFS